MSAFDETGREVFPIVINTICPVMHATAAREIAFNHMRDIEGNGMTSDHPSQMLAMKLGPLQSDEVTHLFCSRRGYTHQVEMEVETLARVGHAWCGRREYRMTDNHDEIKSLFCCVTGDQSALIQALNLEVKP